MRPLAHVFVAASAFAGIGAIALACGTDAVGVDACRQIESARCLYAHNCGIDVSKPVHRDSPTTDIDACIRFYHEECLHGLVTTTEPGSTQVKACVDAITAAGAAGNCDVVKTPEINLACAWLIAPDAGVPDVGPDTADATPFQCYLGCTDEGASTSVCAPLHLCVCPAQLPQTPANCISGIPTVEGTPYCCQ